jgi:hypothetical protein
MVLWFAVLAPVAVAEVFRSPLVDYRMVAAGALLPLVEVVAGRPLLLHTLFAPVAALTVVMVVTIRRRLVRRRLLGLPIGMLVHLVLDATWADATSFWWPAFGSPLDELAVPEVGRPIWVPVVLELVAVVVAVWAWRRYELRDEANRRLLLRTGHLARRVLS